MMVEDIQKTSKTSDALEVTFADGKSKTPMMTSNPKKNLDAILHYHDQNDPERV